MVVVPSGSFMMGSSTREVQHVSNEVPQHSVMMSKPFAVGRFAVTFEEWDACVADGACNGYRPADRGWGRGRQPVINVSWDDAKAYISWLSQRTEKNYRLLSEAEREYVTRAGTTTLFWWGASISTSQANYGGTVSGKNLSIGSDKFGNPTVIVGPKSQSADQTVPVDSFQPNPWGLYQVHGNVNEWVDDCYHNDYTGAPTDGSAWVSENCKMRVARGGDWTADPVLLPAAFRRMFFAGSRGPGIGFRVARAL
jgi:formylglycine-generating enzyme required for sulfatase activity